MVGCAGPLHPEVSARRSATSTWKCHPSRQADPSSTNDAPSRQALSRLQPLIESTSTPSPTLYVEGKIVGLLDLPGPLSWGMVEMRPERDEVRFSLEIDLTKKSPSEIEQLDAGRVTATAEAADTNCNVAVQAQVEGMRRSSNQAASGGHVTTTRSTSWNVRVLAKTDADSVQRAAETAALVLAGGRFEELCRVYLLGVQAMQTIAPVVGLWAFTSVLEEAGSGKPSVKHALNLAVQLRAEGFVIPQDPARHPAAIRAAALHATPKSPRPTLEDVSWFRDLARAYLCDRAGGLPTSP